MLKVLLAASECVPFSKTGGLADVVGSLPKELVRQGVDARVISPLYKSMPPHLRARLEHMMFFYVNLGWRRQYVGVERLVMDGVTYYFIDNEYYFGRPYIYGIGGDEGERFAFFCRAVLEALAHIVFMPDVLHLNDWQTGLIAPLLEIQYRVLPLYKDVKTVFTVHNLQYQGLFPIQEIEDLVSLGWDAYTADKLEFYGQCSCMKAGLTYANKITTVSPSYAKEIQTAYYGEKLDGLLRARDRDLVGILNGIDTAEYDPAADPLIERTYTAEDPSGKAANKLALQAEMGLTQDASVPVIGMVTRLSGQKGLDLVECVLGDILDTGAQLVVLGLGEDKYVDLLGWAQWKYEGRLAARFAMDHRLAHRVYAGSNMTLMPSVFEPCGLSQMIALRYGALPIVRETGGLKDTVLSYNKYTGEGNGFTFLNYNAHDMLAVIRRAVSYYQEHPEVWATLVKRGMTGRYGWDESAKHYIELYHVLTTPPVPETEPAAAEAPKTRAPRKKAAPAKESVKETDGAAQATPKKRAPRKPKVKSAE